ncbi:MAG TPA: hypothetical protein VF522_10945 [Ramlibacter sp.]|uniref:hypothetical protein n=1 Tax=Ramlibacter sp. TaxID=1917967 RepID=UPI002ED2AAE1
MDRTTRTVLPDDTVTTMQCGDRDGVTQFRTIVTDANGKRKATLFALSNLWMARKQLMATAGVVRLRTE